MINPLLAIYHGLVDGWNGTNKHGYLYGITPAEPDQSIIDEIALLEIVIERRKQAAATLEKQLELISDTNKRIIILNKLNVMDKQTFNDIKKLNKLKDMV